MAERLGFPPYRGECSADNVQPTTDTSLKMNRGFTWQQRSSMPLEPAAGTALAR